MPESMKLASMWVVWGFLSLGALGWGLEVVVLATRSSDGLAAWVQAIGSVAAILASVWIARAADRRAEQRDIERNEKVRLYWNVTVLAILDNVRNLLGTLSIIRGVGNWSHVKAVIERQTLELASFDVLDSPSPAIAQAMLDLKLALISQQNFLDQLIASSSQGAFLSFRVSCQKVEQAADRLTCLLT